MTDDGIRRAILNRIEAAQQSCNSTHLCHNEGVVRGLLWALTGEDHGTYLLADTERVFRLAGIPCRREGDRVIHAVPGDDDWPADTAGERGR